MTRADLRRAPAGTPTPTCGPASPRTSRSPAASAAARLFTEPRATPRSACTRGAAASRWPGGRARWPPASRRRAGGSPLGVVAWVWSLAGGPFAGWLAYPLERGAGVGARPARRARRAGARRAATRSLVVVARRHRRAGPAWHRVRGTTTWKGRAPVPDARAVERSQRDVEQDLADVGVGLHVAVGVGDVGEREPPVDHRAQRAGREQRQHLVGEAPADRRFSSSGREPQHRADPPDPLGQQQPDVDRRPRRRPSGRPGRSCPSGARRRRLRSASSPPTRRGRCRRRRVRPCSASPACSAAGQSAGERSRTRSAPRSRQAAAFPAEHVTATRAPMALAIWIAAVPTPDAPAWTSAQRPLVRPPCTTRASHAVRNTSGTAAASASVEPGRHRQRLPGVRDDLLGVAPAGLDAHHGVADRPVGDPGADGGDGAGVLHARGSPARRRPAARRGSG